MVILQLLILIKGFRFANMVKMVCEVSRTHGNVYICYYDYPYLSTFKEIDVFLGSSKFLRPPRCIFVVSVVIVVVMIGHSTKSSMT